MSVQDLLAVEITPARMQLAKEPRLALGPPGMGVDQSDRTVSEYGPTALFEDLAEAVGIDPDAFARELATRQTIDTIGARYGKSPIQMRCAVMDRLRIRLNIDAGKRYPVQHARIDGILEHASKFIDTLMRQSGAFLAATITPPGTVQVSKSLTDQRVV